MVALRFTRTARPIRPSARPDPSSGAWVAAVSVGTPETGMAMASPPPWSAGRAAR